MNRRISLYIGNRLADLSDESFVLFNYTFEDVGNPSVIRNSFSQQINLPGTPANSTIFDEYYRLDRITGSGFNSLQRTPFAIYRETSEILVSGYCKLDRVEYKGEKVYSYSVTLYGSVGGYFYDLSYKPDGTPMNLGDLTYKDASNADWKPNEATIKLKSLELSYVWMSLEDGTVRSNAAWFNVLNFAPCYNGIPADFDAKKVLVMQNDFKDMTSKGTDDKPHPSAGGAYLVTMATDKTCDEMRDYRAYLQRPVLSVKAFLDALISRGGLYITPEARARMDNDMWLTLPMPARALDYDKYEVRGIFANSMTPADLLTSLAKCFGLVFLSAVDMVELMTRDEFYTGGKQIDLEARIDKPSIASEPNGIDAKWYIFKDEVDGAFAKDYRERYGRDYGEQKVNTGWEFDSSSKIVTSQKTRGAVQALEFDRMFGVLYNAQGTYFPARTFEAVSFTGYNAAGTEAKTVNLEIDFPVWANEVLYNTNKPYYDVFDKPQFCGSDKKPTEGEGVLLYLTGQASLPNDNHLPFYLSDDNQTLFDLLNEGRPCWDIIYSGKVRLNKMPHFSRWSEADNLDWGIPAEIDIPGAIVPSSTLYAKYWRDHIAQIYDIDALVVSAKVDLSGMQVDESLLRNEYWFAGSLWRMNRIINHSLTTHDMTECEFIRKVDVGEEGQDSIELAVSTMSVTAEQQTASAFVRATAGWKLLSKPTWCESFSPTRGDASLSYQKVQFSVKENTGDTRQGDIIFALENGTAQATLRITQAGQVTPPEPEGSITAYKHNDFDDLETLNADDEYTEVDVSASGAWTAHTDAAWLASNAAFTNHDWNGSAGVRVSEFIYVQVNTGATRKGEIVFTLSGTTKTCKYTITQEGGGTAKYLYLSPSGEKAVGADVIRQSIGINSNTSWRIDCGTGVKIDGASSKTGTGNSTLEMTFAANTGETAKHNTLTARTTVGTVITSSLDVVQAAVVPEPPVETFLTLSSTSLSYLRTGGERQIVLTSSSNWSVSGVPSWLTLSKSSGAATSGEMLTLTAAYANAERSVTLTFSNTDGESATLTVFQAFNPMSADPARLDYPASGDSIEVDLTCDGAWEIYRLPEWLTADKSSGVGNDTITFTAPNYTGLLARNGNIIINGQGEFLSIPVTQAAYREPETIAWQENSPIRMGRGETVTLHIVTNAQSYSLDKIGNVDSGNWYVSKSGNTVTVYKQTADEDDLTLTATTPEGATATMVLESRTADVEFDAHAWRDSILAPITGSYSIVNNNEEEGYTIDTNLKIEFLNAQGVVLYQTALSLPNTIGAGETISGNAVIASQNVVSNYNLKTATDVRMSVTINSINLQSVSAITNQPPLMFI